MAELSGNVTLCYSANPDACADNMASIVGTLVFTISSLALCAVMIWINHTPNRPGKVFCMIHREEVLLEHGDVWIEIEICRNCCGFYEKTWEWVRVIYRFIVFCVCAGVLTYQASFTGPLLFCAYTVWNFMFLIATFAVGIVTSYMELVGHGRRYKPRDEKTVALLAPELRPTGTTCLPRIRRVHHVMVEVELAASALICLVVWSVLYPVSHSPLLLRAPSLLEHGINIAFMTTEFALRGIHVRLSHIWVFMVLPLTYALFHTGFWWVTGHNLYPFMNVTLPSAPIWAIGIAVAHVFFYVTFWGISSVWLCCSRPPSLPVTTTNTASGPARPRGYVPPTVADDSSEGKP